MALLTSVTSVTSAALLAILIVLVAAARTGDAVRCYECNSHNDSTCANAEPPEVHKKDCSEHKEGIRYMLCRKIVQYIDFEVNGNKPERRVIRSCGWDDSSYKDRCYQRSGFGGRQEVCACSNDYCNAAPHAHAHAHALYLLCALLLSPLTAALL